MTNEQYWNQRIEKNKNVIIQDFVGEISKQYKSMEELLLREIILFYQKALQGVKNPKLSDLYKFNRYYQMIERVQQILTKYGVLEEKTFNKFLERIYTETKRETDKYLNQTFHIREDLVEKAIRIDWVGDEKNYSDRIWANKSLLVNEIRNTIINSIAIGESYANTALEIKEKIVNDSKLSVKKDIKRAFNNSLRLVRTESLFLYNQSKLDSMKEAKIDKYQWIAAMDDRTCPECAALNGKIFKVSEAKVGVNYPVIHPNDRCSVIPVLNIKMTGVHLNENNQ